MNGLGKGKINKRFKNQKAGKHEGRFRAAIDEATLAQSNEYRLKCTEDPMRSVTVEVASSSSLAQISSLSKVQYDGRATMIPMDFVETQAGKVLHIGSPDISGLPLGSCFYDLNFSDLITLNR